ncbi:hypothetical protein HOY82DRAFT_476010, partial [Tuber indicum]
EDMDVGENRSLERELAQNTAAEQRPQFLTRNLMSNWDSHLEIMDKDYEIS